MQLQLNVGQIYPMTARQNMTMRLQMGIWRISSAAVGQREVLDHCVTDAPYVVHKARDPRVKAKGPLNVK